MMVEGIVGAILGVEWNQSATFSSIASFEAAGFPSALVTPVFLLVVLFFSGLITGLALMYVASFLSVCLDDLSVRLEKRLLDDDLRFPMKSCSASLLVSLFLCGFSFTFPDSDGLAASVLCWCGLRSIMAPEASLLANIVSDGSPVQQTCVDALSNCLLCLVSSLDR